MLQWLQVFGRFHLLVLHLPIGLLAGLAAVEFITLIRRRPPAREVTGLLVWCVGVFAALAAAMGYVLSLEGNHGGDVLTQHLYLGIAFAAVCLLTAILHARKRRILFRSSLALAIIILIPTGHLGGTLTHGADFLTSPLQPARAPIPTRTSEPTSSAATFATAIAPILQSRCGDCHGQSRARGGLALHTPEAIITGGKHGAVILPADPASSEILRRLSLPIDHKDRMPPKSKPQPTPEEILAIETWITAGASFDTPFLLPFHEHGALASTASPSITAEPAPRASPSPSLAPPSADALVALRHRLAHVEPVERDSNLLWIDFAAVAPTITDGDIESLLTPINDHIAELSLSRSAITDRALSAIARMPNLRRLELRDTAVTDAGVAALRSHPRLEELILARTRLTDAAVEHFRDIPSLARINLWRTGITPEAANGLRSGRDSLIIETGDRPDDAPVQVEGPITLGGDAHAAAPGSDTAAASTLKPFNTLCPVAGKPVDPDFVIIHRGRIIGFCCRHCAEQFWIDPAKFEPNLGT